MVRIFNKKTNVGILIDDTFGRVTVTPRDYDDDDPHIYIELRGVDLLRHSLNCKNCDSFLKALGTKTTDWYIMHLDKIKRLDLSRSSSKNKNSNVRFNISDWFYGTKLKLNIDSETIESLNKRLQLEEAAENYETCSFIWDKIKSLKES